MDGQEELKRKLEEIKKRQEESQKRKEKEINISQINSKPFTEKKDDDYSFFSAEKKISPNSEVVLNSERKAHSKIIIIIAVFIIALLMLLLYQNSKNTGNSLLDFSKKEELNGYTYKKDDSKTSTFEDTTTPWLDKLYVDGVNFYSNPEVNNAYKDYCSLVNEIEKVDRGIMPGTDKSFREVTYTEVDDAYKYYLKEISQIRQIFDLYNGNDDDLEMNAGCNYRGTKWNTNNNKYKAANFKSNEIIERWNHYAETI